MLAGTALTVAVALGAEPLLDRSNPGPSAAQSLAVDGDGIARTKCLGCHGIDLIAGQRLSRDGWARELDKMVGWGAALGDAERLALLDYLSQRFGVIPATPSAVLPAGKGAAIAATRCLTCHDGNLIDQQRLTADGWAREVEKMIAWGAEVTDSEKPILVDYLAR